MDTVSTGGVVEILMCARDLIKDDRNWCKGTYAKTDTGDKIGLQHENAAKFCVVGALDKSALKLTGSLFSDGRIAAQNLVMDVLDIRIASNLVAFNDSVDTKHSDVIGLYNKAIEIALKKEL